MPSTDQSDTHFQPVSAFKGGPDPRPAAVAAGDHFEVSGVRCVQCGYAVATVVPWCPKCHNDVAPATFGPGGTLWSSTVLHVPVPGYHPPYTVGYVDLDAGPRVLVHLPGHDRIPARSRVRLTAPVDGQLHAEVTA